MVKELKRFQNSHFQFQIKIENDWDLLLFFSQLQGKRGKWLCNCRNRRAALSLGKNT